MPPDNQFHVCITLYLSITPITMYMSISYSTQKWINIYVIFVVSVGCQ